MEIDKNEVISTKYRGKLISVPDFARSKEVHNQAIIYAMHKGLVDYVQIAPRIKMIILTSTSVDYTPNASTSRGVKN